MQRSEIEIMAPVGSYEALAAAIQAGADSVYFGVGKLNMRSASAANFTLDDLAKIVATAHAAGVKTYLTVNTIVYEDEMLTVHEVIDRAKAEGIDAIIATDFAAILYARRIGVEVHISTQSNISNSETVKFFSQWADTVVLARELTLEQVAQIHRQIVENDIRGPRGELVGIEMFAHGALCMSISGKCYLSLYETNCSANRGACRQLCRRKYTVTDTETGAALDIDGRYVLSPKDLCTVDFLDRFIGAGVRVLKIEGRARGAEYVKRVVSCYDEALRAVTRGHDFACARRAVEMAAERGLHVGAHFILGLPGETDEMLLEQVATINSLPLTTVKFHQLQVFRGTPMAAQYDADPRRFRFWEVGQYIDLFVEILRRLRPDLVVERFASEAPPRYHYGRNWGLIRNETLLAMLEKRLEERGAYQGEIFIPLCSNH